MDKIKLINKAYKFRIYPTDEQKIFFEKSFGCTRYIYNTFLKKKIDTYKEDPKAKALSFYDICKEITQLKKQDETSWLKEVDAHSLAFAAESLDNAYKKFFKEKRGFPKFKSKKNNKHSYSTRNLKKSPVIRIENGKLILPKVGRVKGIFHRWVQGRIIKATISRSCNNKYYVSLTVEQPQKELKKTSRNVGIDVGVKELTVFSDGTKVPNNKYLARQLKTLKRLQKKHSRKVKGSANRNKSRLKIASLHAKIVFQRHNMLHNLSTQIINDYDTICLETLNIEGMIKNHKLAQSIADVSWGKFIEMLEYKAKWYGKTVVKINRWFPSSKTCNACGHIKEDLTLKDRIVKCDNCKAVYDRDVNAAKNILDQGIKILNGEIEDKKEKAKPSKTKKEKTKIKKPKKQKKEVKLVLKQSSLF